MCTSPRAPQALAPATTGNSLARDVINIRLGRAAGADQAGMRRAFFKFDFANAISEIYSVPGMPRLGCVQ